MEPKIELAKPRDFGEIVGDTFTFIKQNFKGLLRNFFTFCGFFMLVVMVLSILQRSRQQEMLSQSRSGMPPTFVEMSGNWPMLLILIAVSLLLYVTITLTVLSYIALYKQNGNNPPTTAEMWEYIKYYFWRTTLSLFVTGILNGLGFVLCFLPGIWLFPIMGLVYPIMIIENGSFGYAFNRAFTLIKDNWWNTAGAVLVIWIITYVMMVVITLPAAALSVASLFIRSQTSTAISLPMSIFAAVLQQVAQLVTIIPLVGISLCYFNLAESKEGTSLLDRIDKFGSNTPPTDTPTEEY